MQRKGFDSEKYIEEQSKYILERINQGDSARLYLEFGGKLVHDKHAMRVLPGFDENAKIKLLERLKDQAEIIICIYSGDIVNSKTRQDFGITYDLEVLRLIDIPQASAGYKQRGSHQIRRRSGCQQVHKPPGEEGHQDV